MTMIMMETHWRIQKPVEVIYNPTIVVYTNCENKRKRRDVKKLLSCYNVSQVWFQYSNEQLTANISAGSHTLSLTRQVLIFWKRRETKFGLKHEYQLARTKIFVIFKQQSISF